MKKNNIIAALMLLVMFVLMIASASGDSAIMDELAHIPAGFGYMAHQDYRLNPEHPPLIKDLAALPLLLLDLNFPTDTDAWAREINGQWAQGAIFLYESGNNPDSILFWARLPIMLLALLLGWLIYRFMLRRFDTRAALLALAFFCFSPTVIAHARYVTTDLGASFGFFITLSSLVLFLERPTIKNTLIAGIAFGIAQLLKFSMIIALPVIGITTIIWILLNWKRSGTWVRSSLFALTTLGKLALIFLVSMAVVIPVYTYHVIHYPATSYHTNGSEYSVEELTTIVQLPDSERWNAIKQVPLSQKRDTVYLLGSFAHGPDPAGLSCKLSSGVSIGRHLRCLAEFTIWATDKPMMRPVAQYLLGIEMVLQRAAGGNTTFFLGQVSNGGWVYYFPMLYALKEHLAFHLLTLAALIVSFGGIIRGRKGITAILFWIRGNLFEFTAIFFIVLYWAYSMKSPLNIGIRHVLPTFPFIYMLVARALARWMQPSVTTAAPETWVEWLRGLYELYIKRLPKLMFVGALLGWMIIRTIMVFPNYLSYFNEAVGGNEQGYSYAVDSNYDWGQDLKRLAEFVQARDVKKIALDYFGGGSPRYYLRDKYEPWGSAKGQPHGYFALSATFQQGAWGTPVAGLVQNPADEYEWLKPFRPVARAGDSIFIYKLP